MKTAIVILIGSFVSFLLIAGIFFALYSSNPQAFGVVPQTQAVADTLQHGAKDSLIAEVHQAEQAVKDSIHLPKPADVKPAEQKKPESVKSIVFEDTTDWKSKAKLFEAMSIESASSILQTMNDSEVKRIIPHIKKRNAAKILASFDPDRAARIIR